MKTSSVDPPSAQLGPQTKFIVEGDPLFGARPQEVFKIEIKALPSSDGLFGVPQLQITILADKKRAENPPPEMRIHKNVMYYSNELSVTVPATVLTATNGLTIVANKDQAVAPSENVLNL